MATAAVTYTFANGTNADGTQVNSNFASVVNFLNTETIQRDASIAFTAIPSLPAVDPTTDNQVVRKAYVDNYTPAGVITQYGGTTAPTGWLLCQGQAISRVNALYTRLFTAIGTNYGIGDGSTTFNVPNLQGRIPVGKDATQSEFDALAETGGSKTSTLSTANLPSHQHGVGTIVPNTIANHLHGVGTILPNTIANHFHGIGTLSATNTDLGSHNHTQNAHTHTAPGYIAGYDANGDGLIDGTSATLGGFALSNGGPYTDHASSHNHSISITSHTATNQATALGSHLHVMSGQVGLNGGHTHTMSGSTANDGGHTHTMSGSTALEGSGTSFNNLAPYIVVNYIIKL
jgi:microcystin-dependent protein